jgi:hypothetical protein
MVNIKDTILETIIKYSVISVLALSGAGIGIALNELGYLFLSKIYPDISKKLLSGLLLIVSVLFLIMSAYSIHLYKKNSKKLFPKFGILWDKDLNPYCPHCKGLLVYYPPDQETQCSFECTKCESHRMIADEEGYIGSLRTARQMIAQEIKT